MPPDLGILTEHARKVNPMNLQWCPSVRTLVGTKLDSRTVIVLPIRCRRWTCPYCRICNEILLKEKVAAGHPDRMLTLTGRPRNHETPKEMHDRLRPSISRLYSELRRKIGEVEAATFLELHKSGYPHWHALVRSGYLPWGSIKESWFHLTGSSIVDIRIIKSEEVSRKYVTKYVVKQLSQQIHNRIGRVVTFTRHYCEKVPKPDRKGLLWSLVKKHPLEVVEDVYAGCPAVWDGRVCTLTIPAGNKPSWVTVAEPED